MENDGTKNSQSANDDLPKSATNIQAEKQSAASRKTNQKSSQGKNKKWTLRQHWERASAEKRAKWIFEGIGGLIALLILVNYVWQNLQTKWNFLSENRPRVVFSRPPELLGTFSCQVTPQGTNEHTGAMRVWVKNIRKGDAVGAFMGGPPYTLVPENKIGVGDRFYDNLASITDESCKQKMLPDAMKEVAVNSGQELSMEIRQSAGITTLPPTGIPLPEDTVFQLYMPLCVTYSGEDGEQHTTCQDYRFVVDGLTDSAADKYGFSCPQTPLRGSFEQTVFGSCEN
jgi:hypothetical protein